ncbi:MAG: thioredoxin family protein [Acidobacteria bacterium]|nr:thioredoxin family protein [Acidobacteriota bacterium]
MLITLFLLNIFAGEDSAYAAYEPALQQAKSENKLLFIDFYAVWCGPCKAFTRDSHSKPEIQSRLEKVVLAKIDAEKGEGINWAKKFKVQGYPTYCLVSPQGELLDQWAGYEFNDFQSRFDRALANPTTVAQKVEQYEKKPSADLAEHLGDLYLELGDAQKARQYYASVEKMGVQNFSVLSSLFRLDFDEFGNGNNDVLPNLVQTANQLLNAGEAFSEGPDYMRALINQMVPKLEIRDQTAELASQFHTWIEKNPTRISEKMKQSFQADYQWLVQKDPEAALATKAALMDENWQKDGGALNEIAWWCFERQLFLDKAQAWAQQGVEVSEPGPDRANIWDTLAEIQFLKGDVQGAINSATKAAEENPTRKYFQKQLERFQKEASHTKTGSAP